MFFSISTDGGMSKRRVKKNISLLIQIPDPYIGTEIQVKILQRKACDFLNLTKRESCLESQVVYTGNETIPDIPKTKGMKPDIDIEGANWP